MNQADFAEDSLEELDSEQFEVEHCEQFIASVEALDPLEQSLVKMALADPRDLESHVNQWVGKSLAARRAFLELRRKGYSIATGILAEQGLPPAKSMWVPPRRQRDKRKKLRR